MPHRMARIPVRDTAPELAFRGILSRLQSGPVRTNDPALPGTPDVVLPERKVAGFVHGCFWHHHPGCRHARVPATSYPWESKFARTRRRDVVSRAELLGAGWRVVTVWECALLGGTAVPRDTLDARLRAFLDSAEPALEVAGEDVGGEPGPA
ncbi:very short patch repair endonuclease [Roseomonas sp. GCM10028921]